jgi:hypothetical protein
VGDTAGVAWFKRVCEAQGVAAPGAFRSLLASLSPELLKGPFNHIARSEVGLSQDWYDVQCWPEGERAAMVAPAEAAAAKGRGEDPAAGASAGAVGAAAVTAGVIDGAGLEELRRRLALMLDTEAAAAAL